LESRQQKERKRERETHLAVVAGEGDGENVLGVTNEAAGGGPSGEVPEAELAIPRAGEAELTVGRDHNVLDVVSVADEGATGEAVVTLLTGELPDEGGLVTAQVGEGCTEDSLRGGEGLNRTRTTRN